jgi:hypothetical protein
MMALIFLILPLWNRMFMEESIMNLTKKILTPLLLTVAASFYIPQATATPVIWETDFGDEIADLSGEDDEQAEVSLSFQFNFFGQEYEDFWVGTNGGVQADDDGAGAGADDDIDYDIWDDMGEFLDDESPIFMPFSTDLDLSSTGSIHFNDFGDRAVFTWNEVGTYEEDEHLVSFQMQLLSDGSIIFAYNGLLDNDDEDLLESLNEGILVGISASDDPDDPFTSDLNGGDFLAGTTVFELWCYDEVDSCDGFDGPMNTAFDLDQSNIIFTPEGDGFRVSSLVAQAVPEPSTLITMLLGLVALVSRKKVIGK